MQSRRSVATRAAAAADQLQAQPQTLRCAGQNLSGSMLESAAPVDSALSPALRRPMSLAARWDLLAR